jgi:uncharacterized lipoprotein YajG
MKRIIFSLIFVALLLTACQAVPSISESIPPYVDTGIDANAWVTIPAGNSPQGKKTKL